MTREMINSGIDWIGEIPEDWTISKIGSHYTERNIKVSDLDYEPLSVTKNGIVLQLENVAKSSNHSNRKLVKVNDFVINSRSDRKMSSGLSSYQGSVSVINIVLYSKTINKDFTKYILKNYSFAEEFYRWGTGIVDDLWSTKWNRLKRINIPIPPVQEQDKISKLIDQKTKDIDSLTRETRESIEELAKYRQSIITEAVTKGLNPNVEMKNSEIEWIGSVPIHWMLSKISKVTSSYSGGTPSRNVNNYWENGSIPWVSSGEVSKKLIYESNEYITDLGLRNSSAKMMPKNTVIVALNGQGKTKGSSAILKISASTNQSLVGFICNKELLDYRFLNYVFNASYSYNRSYYAGGNKREGIAASDLRGKRIPLPPLEEQIIIVNHLEEINNNIDKLILDKTNLIEELENYKKSVIYEYVTGKKEA